MYSLDTNFLKDRQIDEAPASKAFKAPKKKATFGELMPLFGGAAVGIVPLALVAGLWLVSHLQKQSATEEMAGLERELSELEVKNQKIQQIKQEIDQAQAEAQAFASVFNQVKPWSAILQDLRDRIPKGVQIVSIKQEETLPKEDKNSAATNQQLLPEIELDIQGIANDYEAVNDFVLSLQKSRFLKREKTLIEDAKLEDSPFELQFPETENAPKIEVELPKVVKYTIVTQLSDTPAAELLRELDRKGAVGLVTRIRTLEDKGVIQP